MAERIVGVVLYPKFELLDVFGPCEAFGVLEGFFKIVMVAQHGGTVQSAQGPRVAVDHTFDSCPQIDIILVPGGMGTRDEIDNPVLLDWLKQRAAAAEYVTSVCTGASLLACAGLLKGRRATTNKMFFQWASEQGPAEWVREARWVEDGKFVTSSGVSAGIDMALAIIAKTVGPEVAENAANGMEYTWHRDPHYDPFAKLWGLV